MTGISGVIPIRHEENALPVGRSNATAAFRAIRRGGRSAGGEPAIFGDEKCKYDFALVTW